MKEKTTRRRRMVSHSWEPLTMTWSEVAFAVFRASELWLREHVADYADFPEARDDLFSRRAVETWCDLRWGAVRPEQAANDTELEDLLIARAKERGHSKNQVSRRAAA